MEPQNSKKSLILVGVAALLVGLVFGAFGGFYYLKSRLENLIPVLTGKPNVNYQVSQETINKLTSLEPGKTFSGKVSKKDNSGIVLDIWFYNSINPASNRSLPTQIPFNPAIDKVIRPNVEKIGAATIPASYNNIKVGDYINVSIFKDHKEFIIPIPVE
ncbi:hypothetical protein HZB05_00380 [Candidatus Wolfebacteria bacterium]|nr:hypothetical protein [Candidatus Wolfebacteria bacterium]